MELFEILTIDYHLDFADAFHIIAAMSQKCSLLIIKDGSMRESGVAFIKDNKLEDSIKIYNIEEFLNIC